VSLLVSDVEVSLSKRLTDYFSGTTTSAGNAGGTTMISTDFLRWPNRGLAGKFIEITSGSADGEVRRVKDLTGSTTELESAFTAQIATSVTFRIHDVWPEWKIEAIDEALRELTSLQPRVFMDTFLGGELCRNRGLEYWRTPTQPYDWTVTGTIAQSGTEYEKEFSISITSGSAIQEIPLEVELEGLTLTLTAYLRSAAAAAGMNIQIIQGANSTASAALGTNDAFTKLTVTNDFTITPGAPLQIKLNNSTATACLFDLVSLQVPAGTQVLWIPLSDGYRLPLSEVQSGPLDAHSGGNVQGFTRIGMPDHVFKGYGWYSQLGGNGVVPESGLFNQGGYSGLAQGRWIKLVGESRYMNISAASDTIPIENDEMLSALAAVRVCRKAINDDYRGSRELWKERESIARDELSRIVQSLRVAHAPIRIR